MFFSLTFKSNSIWYSVRPSAPHQVMGILCMQLLLHFYTDSFETLHGLKNVHIYLDIILKLFLSLFSQTQLSHFSSKTEKILSILCMQLLLQFYFDSFETLQVFRSWSEDVHIIRLFLSLFQKMNLVIFQLN